MWWNSKLFPLHCGCFVFISAHLYIQIIYGIKIKDRGKKKNGKILKYAANKIRNKAYI